MDVLSLRMDSIWTISRSTVVLMDPGLVVLLSVTVSVQGVLRMSGRNVYRKRLC